MHWCQLVVEHYSAQAVLKLVISLIEFNYCSFQNVLCVTFPTTKKKYHRTNWKQVTFIISTYL